MYATTRALIGLTLALVMLIGPSVALAQETSGTASEGAFAGQMDGKANTSGFMWFGAGCLFGILGVGAAYLITPNPPAVRLLGKSMEYTAAYTDAYRESAKSAQTNPAWIGCVVSSLVNSVVWIVYYAALMAAY